MTEQGKGAGRSVKKCATYQGTSASSPGPRHKLSRGEPVKVKVKVIRPEAWVRETLPRGNL